MAITKTAIVQEYGAYYIDGGQNLKHLLSLLIQGREVTQYATPVKTDNDLFRLGNTAFDSLVQPFQKTFTQKGGIEITPNEIRVFPIKIDDEMYPDDVKASWLGFLAGGTLTRQDWPLIKYLLEYYYKKKIDSDMELNEYYKGVFKAPTAGVAGPNGTAMDGLQKLLQAGVDNDTINSVDIGVLNVATIFDQVELFTDKISEVYQGIEMNVFMSRPWYKKYLQDKRSQGFYQKTSDKEIDGGIDFTPLSVKPLACMVNTNDIWCTPKANLLHITPESMNKYNYRVEEAKRSVAIMADWKEGLGFGLNGAVWTNIQKTKSGSV
jgi:hypothetical protein